MTRSILKAIICGVIVGALAFFMPPLLLGIFVLFLLFRLFHCGSRRHGCCGHGHYGHTRRMFYMADKIRKMSEEEYAEFKENMGGNCCDNGYHRHDCCDSKSEKSDCCKTKKVEETSK
jgi:hypothetical protein